MPFLNAPNADIIMHFVRTGSTIEMYIILVSKMTEDRKIQTGLETRLA